MTDKKYEEIFISTDDPDGRTFRHLPPKKRYIMTMMATKQRRDGESQAEASVTVSTEGKSVKMPTGLQVEGNICENFKVVVNTTGRFAGLKKLPAGGTM